MDHQETRSGRDGGGEGQDERVGGGSKRGSARAPARSRHALHPWGQERVCKAACRAGREPSITLGCEGVNNRQGPWGNHSLAAALSLQAVTCGRSGRRRVGTQRSSRGVPCTGPAQCHSAGLLLPVLGRGGHRGPAGGQSAPRWRPQCHISQRHLCPEFRSHLDI